MYVARVPNRSSPPAILLRESYRVGDKVKTRTLANLSGWPEAKIQALARLLKDEAAPAPADRLGLRARPEIIESTSDRVNIEFTTAFSYHIWWS